MNRACATALAALVLCSVAPAAAQDQLVTTFVPEAQRRWDAAGFVGLAGRRQVRRGSRLERLVRRRGVQRLGGPLPDTARQDRRRSLDHIHGPRVRSGSCSARSRPPFYGRLLHSSRVRIPADDRCREHSRTSSSRTDGCIRSSAPASRACARRSGSRCSSCRQAVLAASAADSRDSSPVLGAAVRHRRREVLRVGTRVHSHRHADHIFVGRRRVRCLAHRCRRGFLREASHHA